VKTPERNPYGPVSVSPTAFGDVLSYTFDDPIGLSIRRFGEWAGAEIGLMTALMRPGDRVLDVGANIGFHTLAFAEKVGASGEVHAFEAHPALYEVLQANVVSATHADTVTTHLCAVADVGGASLSLSPLALDAPVNAGATSPGTVVNEGDLSVQTITLDSLELDRCDFIKIDVEGMEPAVLRGAEDLIRRTHPTLWLECNDVDAAATLLQTLGNDERPVLFVQTSAFRSNNFRNNQENNFGVARETALLVLAPALLAEAMRPREGVTVRLFSSLNELAELLLANPQYGDETEYDRDPNVLRQHLRQTREEVDRLHVDLEESKKSQQELLAALNEAATEMRGLRDSTVALQARAENSEERIAALQAQVARAEERTWDYHVAYTAATAALSLSEERAQGLARQLAEEQERTARTDEQWREAVHEISKIRSTLSWRMTKPLRSVGRPRRRR
jgi:FkbM family methyltransferase